MIFTALAHPSCPRLDPLRMHINRDGASFRVTQDGYGEVAAIVAAKLARYSGLTQLRLVSAEVSHIVGAERRMLDSESIDTSDVPDLYEAEIKVEA